VISILGLEKAFGPVHAVRGVDLRVEPGEILVLLGQNGAGKSTTLRCAGGVLRPDAGQVHFGDLSLPGDVDAVRRRLGVVPDQARLYGRNTALEYLDHFGRLYGVAEPDRSRRIAELLERFELGPESSRPLATFSRGMAQKVALIRATLHAPDWLFCDEPTSGLDPIAAADMRAYLVEQRDRGAALVVTTHILGEAELMADRVAIMRHGLVVIEGSLDELRRQAPGGRRQLARLATAPARTSALLAWVEAETGGPPALVGQDLSFTLPWDWDQHRAARFAAQLQARLAAAEAPFFGLQEQPPTLESIYLRAMAAPEPAAAAAVPGPARMEGIRPRRMVASLRGQPALLRHLLPFYVSSWWRRGDLSWVLYLNGFVLLLIAGASLFGSLPTGGAIAARLGRGSLDAGLLLPLFFMTFALLESIKTSIGIWWEKAQGSLEVLLFAPLDDPSLVWMEVLPGAVVSLVWVTAWMAAGMALLALFGRPAPWPLLPVFGLVALVTAYWAAMGRMLGFLLFPREGAAGGAWSFLLSPVSAAVADLPLALFVVGSPLAPLSLLLPLAACVALTILVGVSFDRERLMEAGVSRRREPSRWYRGVPLRAHAGALAASFLVVLIAAGSGAALSSALGVHTWGDLRLALAGGQIAAGGAGGGFGAPVFHLHGGVNLAAAALAGVAAALALALALLALNFAAFFLLGVPELALLLGAGVLWGAQAGFGPSAPLAGWLGVGGGIVLLALTLNTAAALPIYSALVFGAGRRLDRLRAAWAGYFALYRGLVLPCCAAFGLAVIALLAAG
jgi:ABC-2 type transport system ATP-binding protein